MNYLLTSSVSGVLYLGFAHYKNLQCSPNQLACQELPDQLFETFLVVMFTGVAALLSSQLVQPDDGGAAKSEALKEEHERAVKEMEEAHQEKIKSLN